MSTLIYTRQSRLILAVGLTLLLISLLLALPAGPVGVAESAPLPPSTTPYPGCIRDNGSPVVPLNFPNAWSVMLSFNHPGSDQATPACWAIRDKNLTVWYQAGIMCQLINNVGGVKVGNGVANFDGNFHIQCPPGQNKNLALYNSFYVHADVELPLQDGFFPLVDHPDFYVHVKRSPDPVSGEWHGSIHTVMGGMPFEAYNSGTTLPTGPMAFNSVVNRGEAYHFIDGSASKRVPISPFSVDMLTGIKIGGGDIPWTLSEIIIDPPEFCDSGC